VRGDSQGGQTRGRLGVDGTERWGDHDGGTGHQESRGRGHCRPAQACRCTDTRTHPHVQTQVRHEGNRVRNRNLLSLEDYSESVYPFLIKNAQ